MAYMTITWKEFLTEAAEFLKISKKLGDDWELQKKNDNEGNAFLCYKKKVREKATSSSNLTKSVNAESADDAASCLNKTSEVYLVEYHIVYSMSYQVPVLYLRVQRNDGSFVELEQVWRIFRFYEYATANSTRADMLTILTQMEHPVLFKPFYAIHPCRTAELLGQTPASSNRIITFMSIMGPYVQLNLDNRYGLEMEAARFSEAVTASSKWK